MAIAVHGAALCAGALGARRADTEFVVSSF